MATPKKIQYKDYADYLKSPKWKQVKVDFKKESIFDHECFFCLENTKLHHHHWQYPTDWNDDHYSNLVLLCKDHHTTTHELIPEEYKPKSFIHYISCLSSLMIGDAHCRGFQEGIAKGEDRSIDVANEFISSSNIDIDKMRQVQVDKDMLLNTLNKILDTEGLTYKYLSESGSLKDRVRDKEPRFVEIFCPKLRVAFFDFDFEHIIDMLDKEEEW